ncbi:MAG: hypothetical protein GY774_00225 [Planctomycetes bacterium]|nr:hypothetical protein [Planctomycetota bacterium]
MEEISKSKPIVKFRDIDVIVAEACSHHIEREEQQTIAESGDEAVSIKKRICYEGVF